MITLKKKQIEKKRKVVCGHVKPPSKNIIQSLLGSRNFSQKTRPDPDLNPKVQKFLNKFNDFFGTSLYLVYFFSALGAIISIFLVALMFDNPNIIYEAAAWMPKFDNQLYNKLLAFCLFTVVLGFKAMFCLRMMRYILRLENSDLSPQLICFCYLMLAVLGWLLLYLLLYKLLSCTIQSSYLDYKTWLTPFNEHFFTSAFFGDFRQLLSPYQRQTSYNNIINLVVSQHEHITLLAKSHFLEYTRADAPEMLALFDQGSAIAQDIIYKKLTIKIEAFSIQYPEPPPPGWCDWIRHDVIYRFFKAWKQYKRDHLTPKKQYKVVFTRR